MTKLLLINPIIRQEDQPKHTPFGLSLVAACAEKWFNAQVAIYDINILRSIMPVDEIYQHLTEVVESEEWDVIGIGGLTTSYNSIKKALKLIRPLTDSLIVLGGGIATAQPKEMLTWLPEVDLLVLGEAVETIGDVLKYHERRGEEWQGILGTAYRDKTGTPRINRERPLIPDIDILPDPAWELLHMDLYFKNSAILLSEEAMTAKKRIDLAASFGCPISCKFCWDLGVTGLRVEDNEPRFVRVLPHKVKRLNRYHSPEYIVAQIKRAIDKLWDVEPEGPIDFVAFIDENFIAMERQRPGWIKAIHDAIIEEGLQPECCKLKKPHDQVPTCKGIHFGATSHAGLITKELLEIMKDMGFTYLDYGLESFCNKNLREIRKGSTREKNINAVKMTLEAGIRPIPNQIIGFPEEDWESIREDMLAWQELGVVVYPFICTPYPGSEYYYQFYDKILEEFQGDLEAFVMELGDATKPVVSISKNFTAEELIKIRDAMVSFDWDLIDKYEKIWCKKRGLPYPLPRTHDCLIKSMEKQTHQEPITVGYKPEHIKIRESRS